MVDVRPYLEGAEGMRHPTSRKSDVTQRVINNDNGDVVIYGEAIEGTAESDSAWKIFRCYYSTTNLSFESKKWPQNASSKADNDYQFIWDSSDTASITGITAQNPPVVTTSSAHGWSDGDKIFIESVAGMTEINSLNSSDRIYKIANSTATTFELTDEDDTNINASGYTAYSSGGTATRADMINYTYS